MNEILFPNTACRKGKWKYTWPGSNWRPSACEADVIATRPQVLWKMWCRLRNVIPARVVWSHVEKMVPRGLEPRTLRLLAVRSNQLSYETVGDTGLVFETMCHRA